MTNNGRYKLFLNCRRMFTGCYAMFTFKVLPINIIQNVKGTGELLLWDIIREKSGSRVNLPPGGGGGQSYFGVRFPGGGGLTRGDPTLQHRYQIYTFTIFKLLLIYFVNIFWKCVNIEHFNAIWKFSKCVKLVSNLTHFEKKNQSALSWSKIERSLKIFWKCVIFFQNGLLHGP